MAKKAAPKESDKTEFTRFLEELKVKLLKISAEPLHILVVTCIDLRYTAMINHELEIAADKFFHMKYDLVSLAGAGLAAVIDFPPHPKPQWAAVFIEQVALCKKLHDIVALVVLEHRDCGAYREFGLLRADSDEGPELAAHKKQMVRLESIIKKHFPEIHFFWHLLPNQGELKEQHVAHMGKLERLHVARKES